MENVFFVQSDDAEENVYLYNTGNADWITANVNSEKIIDKDAIQINAEFATMYYFFKNSSKKQTDFVSEN